MNGIYIFFWNMYIGFLYTLSCLKEHKCLNFFTFYFEGLDQVWIEEGGSVCYCMDEGGQKTLPAHGPQKAQKWDDWRREI